MLKDRERRPRKYTKKSEEYWITVIKDRRAARKCISYNKPNTTTTNSDEHEPVEIQPKNITMKRKAASSASKRAPKKKTKRK